MTRKEMVQVLKEGGSIMLGSRIITNAADLPHEEDLAQTEEEMEEVAGNLRGQLEEISSRLARIEGTPGQAEQVALLQSQIDEARLERDEAVRAQQDLSKALQASNSRIVELEAAAAKPAAAPSGGQDAVQGTILPDNFPNKAELTRAGLATVEAVRGLSTEQLVALEGIGPRSAKAIQDALAS